MDMLIFAYLVFLIIYLYKISSIIPDKAVPEYMSLHPENTLNFSSAYLLKTDHSMTTMSLIQNNPTEYHSVLHL